MNPNLPNVIWSMEPLCSLNIETIESLKIAIDKNFAKHTKSSGEVTCDHTVYVELYTRLVSFIYKHNNTIDLQYPRQKNLPMYAKIDYLLDEALSLLK